MMTIARSRPLRKLSIAEWPSVSQPPGPDMVKVAAGPFEMGAPAGGFAYDNERSRHVVDLPAFEIDRLPVTVGDWIQFMDAEGAAEPIATAEDAG